jgi:hypothetical protein
LLWNTVRFSGLDRGCTIESGAIPIVHPIRPEKNYSG